MIFLYLFLLIFVIFYELFRKKEVFVDFLSIFHVFFVISYVLVPVFYLANEESHEIWRFLALQSGSASSVIVFICISVAYFCLLIGFNLGAKNRLSKLHFKSRFSLRSEYKAYVYLFLTLLLLLLIYSLGFGGIKGLLTLGQKIRANEVSGGFFGYFSYLAFGIMTMPLFFYSVFLYSPKKKIIYKIIFLVSLIFSLIYGLSTGGRGNAGMTIILLFIMWMNFDGKKLTVKKLINFSMLFAFIGFMAMYGRSAIVALDSFNTGESYIEKFTNHQNAVLRNTRSSFDSTHESAVSFLKYYDHTFASLYPVLFESEVFEFPRLFLDYPRGFASLIPGIRLPEFFVTSMTADHAQNYFRKIDPNRAGYVPIGWVGMKYVNGGFFWLVVGSLISGFIGGVIHKILINNYCNSYFVPGLYIYFAMFWQKYFIAPEGTTFFFGMLGEFLILFTIFNVYSFYYVKLKSNPAAAYMS